MEKHFMIFDKYTRKPYMRKTFDSVRKAKLSIRNNVYHAKQKDVYVVEVTGFVAAKEYHVLDHNKKWVKVVE